MDLEKEIGKLNSEIRKLKDEIKDYQKVIGEKNTTAVIGSKEPLGEKRDKDRMEEKIVGNEDGEEENEDDGPIREEKNQTIKQAAERTTKINKERKEDKKSEAKK